MTTDHTASAAEAADPQHGYISEKNRYLARLKRIEGQARGLQQRRGRAGVRRRVVESTVAIDSNLSRGS